MYFNPNFIYLGCGPGYYGHTYSRDEDNECHCFECLEGTYNDKMHTTSCTWCPVGSTLQRGATSSSDCQISKKFRYVLLISDILMFHTFIVTD